MEVERGGQSAQPRPFRPSLSIFFLSLLSLPASAFSRFSAAFIPPARHVLPLPRVIVLEITPGGAGLASGSSNVPAIKRRRVFSIHASTSSDDGNANDSRGSAGVVGNSSIPGLMSEEDFTYRCAVHETLASLQSQLPQTLTVPVNPKAAERTYAADCTLVGPKGEVLGTDRDEIMALSQTIATAVGTARRAGRLASSYLARDGISGKELDLDLVDCQLTLDSSLSVLHVKWTTELPVTVTNLPSRQNRPHSELVGSSLFTFNRDGLVSKHQILHVELDGRSIDAVGETLASLRRTVKSVTERSPWVLEAAEAAAPLLADLAELASTGGMPNRSSGSSKDEIGEVPKGDLETEEAPRAQVFVSDLPKSQRNNASSWKMSTRWAVDNFLQNDTTVVHAEKTAEPQYPLPGGLMWEKYEATHRNLQSFVTTTIHYLAGEVDPGITPLSDGKSYRDLFLSDVKMKAFDGTTLIQGGGRVSDLYRAASALRQSGGVAANADDAWKVTDVAVDWVHRTVEIKWLSTIQLKVEGTDKFYLNDNGEIEEIEQKELIIGGSKIIDAAWLRSIVSAVESSRGGAGGEILGDVLKRISRGQGGSRHKNQVEIASTKKFQAPPKLDDAAAVTFYSIIRSLHTELPLLADVSPTGRSAALTPAEAFLSDDIELRGLLDETLARGTKAYSQALSASIGSLRAAIRTGSLRTTRDIVPRIEVTPTGTIKVSVEINLRVEPPSLPTFPARSKAINENDKKNSSRQPSLLDFGIPLDLELISEYKVDRNGEIIEHRITENRVNGQKSPADVVSNWVKQETEENEAFNSERTVQAFIDAINWARSLRD